MTRPTYATIDTAAFVDNYRLAKRLAPHSRAIAVVKANAYGHGAIPLARALAPEADAFAVASSEEAMELRESGIGNPILLLEGVFEPDELVTAARHDLMITVHSDLQLAWLESADLPRPLSVWLKIDTGMHRLGFPPERLQEIHARLTALAQVADVVVMTHFARADETDQDATRQQLSRLRASMQDLRAPCCLSNSAALLAWPETLSDWVRPGIMLYGVSPVGKVPVMPRPVMRLESQLIAVHMLQAGDAIGYGGRFVCDRPTRVGVIAIGYADGYPRHAPDGTPIAVCGVRTKLAGRVSMDMTTVDLTDVPHAQIGDPVELWGDIVGAGEVAEHSGTIAYELFTHVNRRVHLLYR